ncbi:hypothetical protein OWM07_09820 [Deferribacter thermophilus]|uniref:hypothetical protein n=1 Tax=Deferribacter thermophilus TaxID=53573 RepID=UPI003C1A77ED
MHEGCSGIFENGKQIVDKLRAMGFSNQYMPIPMKKVCENCNTEFVMETFEARCPNCNMTYGVTPCHAYDPENIKAAGINY